MHLGRMYSLKEYLVWMRRETVFLFLWSALVTALLEITHWQFLEIPGVALSIVGVAVAIILGFKNEECHSRVNEALTTWEQITSASRVWANKSLTIVGQLKSAQAAALLRTLFYRHFAWLAALRFSLRARKPWENTFEAGNARYLAALPTPESQSNLDDELRGYLSEAEFEKTIGQHGDKGIFILGLQYKTFDQLLHEELILDSIYVRLTDALDDFVRLQETAKRIKEYPYARNYYSIALILVKLFIGMLPLSLYSSAVDLGRPIGAEHWTAWLTVVFSVILGWIFMTLEKVGENSSNPFEGGPNDVPISAISRSIEIEMRGMLGEHTELKPIEPRYNILF